VKVDSVITCSVNFERRRPIMANHTSTHMVNFALAKVLPSEVEQRGSIVGDEKFRFDFTSPEGLTRDQLFQAEEMVKKMVKSELPVYSTEVPLELANKINGRRAIFTESYPDPVRVVSVGVSVEKLLENPTSEEWTNYSIEFCGGTHISNTSEVVEFTIVSEEAISLGERRIVAVTGAAASTALEEASRLNNSLELLLVTPTEELSAALVAFKDDLARTSIPAYLKMDIREKLKEPEEKVRKAAKDEIAKKKEGSESFTNEVIFELKENPSATVVVKLLEVGDNQKVLSDTSTSLVALCKKSLNRDVGNVLLSVDHKKGVVLIVGNVPPELVAKGLKANAWTNEIAVVLGGKGGGNPKGEVGHGKGTKVDAVPEAIAKGLEYGSKF